MAEHQQVARQPFGQITAFNSDPTRTWAKATSAIDLDVPDVCDAELTVRSGTSAWGIDMFI
ncbi:hypothetical protein ACFU5Y_13985 [Streptomyces gardneri]|uniref:hypothetical protein n=1 Tax=Streptomyces gardneri TaxID=66892 RepID=UPI00367E9F66